MRVCVCLCVGCRVWTCPQLSDISLSQMLPCKFWELHTYNTSVITAMMPKTRWQQPALDCVWLYFLHFLFVTIYLYILLSICFSSSLPFIHHQHILWWCMNLQDMMCVLPGPLSQIRALHGVPALVKLFSSDNQAVQRYATGATRNLIYENSDNKVALVDAGGVMHLVSILSQPDEELRKTITGFCFQIDLNSAHERHHASIFPRPLFNHLIQLVLIIFLYYITGLKKSVNQTTK